MTGWLCDCQYVIATRTIKVSNILSQLETSVKGWQVIRLAQPVDITVLRSKLRISSPNSAVASQLYLLNTCIISERFTSQNIYCYFMFLVKIFISLRVVFLQALGLYWACHKSFCSSLWFVVSFMNWIELDFAPVLTRWQWTLSSFPHWS